MGDVHRFMGQLLHRRRIILLNLAAILATFGVTVAYSQTPVGLVEAGEGFGVSLIETSFTRAESNNALIETAVIDGFQNIPASEYHEGVDVAILNYQSEELKIEPGLYKLSVRTVDPVQAVGAHDAISELTNQAGEVIYTQEHTIDVFSVNLPPGEGPRNVVPQLLSTTTRDDNGAFQNPEWTISFCCDNGTCGTCIGPDCP